MADALVATAGLVAAAVRLPAGSAESQIIKNQGPGVAYLGGSSAVTPASGVPFPVASELRLYKNGSAVFACTGGDTAVPATPAVPASTVNATNTTGEPVAVTVTGGTITAVVVNAVTVSTVTGVTVVVPAGQTISITYTVAPTWVWKHSQPALLAVKAGITAT